MRRAFDFEDKDVSLADSFLRDLLKSVCVMQIEGVEYTFTHRSFQEYFAAYFISRSLTLIFHNYSISSAAAAKIRSLKWLST